MPKSPIEGNIDLVAHKIKIENTEISEKYAILDIQIEKAINKVPTARIVVFMEFAAGDDKAFEVSEEAHFAPGKKIEILLGYNGDVSSVYKGIIVNLGIRAYHKHNELILDCSDKAVKMTQGRKSKYFKEKTDKAIISSILTENGLPAAVDATDYEHKQLIQYHATDWDFIRMRAEANGLLVFIEDGKVQVKKPKVDGSAKLEVTYGKDVLRMDSRVDSRYQMPTIKAYSWSMSDQKMVNSNAKEPSVNNHGNLTGKALNKVLNTKEFTYYSSAPLERNDMKAWVNSHLLQTRLARIYGDVEIIGTPLAKLNTILSIKGFGSRMNGDALITKIKHQAKGGFWTTTIGFGLSADIFANRPDVHEPPAHGLLSAVEGLQVGKVMKISDDPGNEFRIQVDIPAIPGGNGIWARLTNFYSTGGKGAFFIPEVDDEVIVGFLNNDPRFAIIMGSLYSSKIKTPYPSEKGNPIKAIVTKNDLKLEFNDKEKVITIETPGGNKIILSDKDKSILLEDESGNKIEMKKGGITIKSPKEIKIEAGTKIVLSAKTGISGAASAGNIELAGKDVSLDAKMNFSATGKMGASLESSLNATINGSAICNVKGGLVKIN